VPGQLTQQVTGPGAEVLHPYVRGVDPPLQAGHGGGDRGVLTDQHLCLAGQPGCVVEQFGVQAVGPFRHDDVLRERAAQAVQSGAGLLPPAGLPRGRRERLLERLDAA
jgi:hypothetical protein